MATLLAKVRVAAKTRAKTSATNVAGLDTGPVSADHPHPTQLLNQPKHLMDSSILVAMLSFLLIGKSTKLKKPSLMETRSFAGAPSAIVEKEPVFLIMSLLTMTPGGLRCRPNANRP